MSLRIAPRAVAMTCLALVLVLAAGVADAGTLLYAKNGSLWQHGEGKKGAAESFAALPAKGVVREILADKALRTVVVRIDDAYYTIKTLGRSNARKLDCIDRADLDNDGRCLICRIDEDGWQVTIFGAKKRSYRLSLGEGPAVFHKRGRLLVLRPSGIWSSNVIAGRRRRILSETAEDIASSPDGKRAAALFSSDQYSGLYTLRLATGAAPRRLLPNGRVVAWSRDSKWLLVDYSGAACVIRAAGGQYKCWNRHRPVAISGDGSTVYLIRHADASSKSVELLSAPTTGSSTAKPKTFAKNISPAAAWLPVESILAK